MGVRHGTGTFFSRHSPIVVPKRRLKSRMA